MPQQTLQGRGRVEALRALLKNTNVRVAVALCAVLCALLGLSACSGGAPGSATALLNDTFSGSKPIESAKLDMSLSLTGEGGEATAEGTPLSIALSGPFEDRDTSKIPHFALQLDLSAGGQALRAGATSTGSTLYVDLAGTWFSTPQSTYQALQTGFSQATKALGSSTAKSSFSALGIEPGRWVSNPKKVGTATVGKAKTVHIAADVNIQAFLADVQKLSGSGVLGAGSALGVGSLSTGVISELAKSIKSAHVDIYTGESDHLLRLLELEAHLSATARTRSALSGLENARVKLKLEFSDLNQPQTIAAPANPKAASELLPALQTLLGGLQSLGGSSSSSVR